MHKKNFGISRISRIVFALVALAVSDGAPRLSAGTVTIDDYLEPFNPSVPTVGTHRRGEYRAGLVDDDDDLGTPPILAGSHPSTPVMFIGQSGDEFSQNYNSFVVFNLAPVLNQTITGASLRLELLRYWGLDSSETISIHEVTTPVDTSNLLRSWTENEAAVPIFNDLQDTTGGTPLGTASIARPAGTGADVLFPAASYLDIPLSAQAVAAINASGGLFALGIHLDTISSPVGTEEGIRFANGNEARNHQLILTVVPDGGATVGMLSLACLGCMAMSARSRKQRS